MIKRSIISSGFTARFEIVQTGFTVSSVWFHGQLILLNSAGRFQNFQSIMNSLVCCFKTFKLYKT
ncbi:hypothetical protein Hanom_Chr08g00710021 [Helianthus anomalus]